MLRTLLAIEVFFCSHGKHLSWMPWTSRENEQQEMNACILDNEQQEMNACILDNVPTLLEPSDTFAFGIIADIFAFETDDGSLY